MARRYVLVARRTSQPPPAPKTEYADLTEAQRALQAARAGAPADVRVDLVQIDETATLQTVTRLEDTPLDVQA